MKKFVVLLISIITITTMISCSKSQSRIISIAISLSDDNPDSAIQILKRIDRKSLNQKEQAEYAVIYTKSQDKLGINVDNDSLIGLAYNWYKNRRESSLYATCQYYMGKYYMLNDNTEQSIQCLEEATKYAKENRDTTLECLSLELLSKNIDLTEPTKAIEYANQANNLYNKYSKNNNINKVYYLLNISNCYTLNNDAKKALPFVEKALRMAKATNDSDIVSETYQTMSVIYGVNLDNNKSLNMAKLAYKYSKKKDTNLKFSLVSAYLNSDSIQQSYQVLNEIEPGNNSEKYVKYYYLSQIEIQLGNKRKIKAYSDSSRQYIEKMYTETLKDKDEYYSSLLNSEKEKLKFEAQSSSQKFIFVIITTFLFFIILFVIYAYKEHKRRGIIRIKIEKEKSIMQIKHEREIHEKDKEIAEKLHKEEIAHREIQISTMRNFLMKKIDIVNKLQKLKSNPKHILLTNNDWEELEVFLNGASDAFVIRLRKKFPNMSEQDVRLMMLLRLKMSQKSLAEIYCISEKAVKQKLYLYKSKVGIDKAKISLREYIESF